MTLPGNRLRTLARRCFSDVVMERIIDPTIADLQCEYRKADASGSAGRRARSLLVGYAGFWRAVALVAPVCSLLALRLWASADDAAMGRTVRTILLTLLALVVLLAIPPLWMTRSKANASGWLVVYLISQAVAIGLPMAVLAGVTYGLRRVSDLSWSRIGRLRRAVAVVGCSASLVVFSMTVWVVPKASQAFRVAVAGFDVRKGLSEMSFGEVRWLVHDMRTHGQPRLAGRHELVYQARLGVAGATWCFAMLAFALSTAPRQTTRFVASAAILVATGYWVCLFFVMRVSGPILEVPWMAIVLAWLPDLVLLMASIVLLVWHRSHHRAAAMM